MTKEQKYLFVVGLAQSLVKNELKMKVSTLANVLNDLGFRTVYGSEYEGERGSYRLVHVICDWADNNLGPVESDAVAKAFTNDDGGYAYVKE